MRYLKVIYIELLYLFFSSIFLYRLNNLNRKLILQDEHNILSYNSYQPVHFLITSAILIIIAVYIIKYRWTYVFSHTEEFGEICTIFIANVIIIFSIYLIIVFINHPILRAFLKAICAIGALSETKSSRQ